MSQTYYPSKWTTLKFTSDKYGKVYKILGEVKDNWFISSALTYIEVNSDRYSIITENRDLLVCYKKDLGFTSATYDIFQKWLEEATFSTNEVAIANIEMTNVRTTLSKNNS